MCRGFRLEKRRSSEGEAKAWEEGVRTAVSVRGGGSGGVDAGDVAGGQNSSQVLGSFSEVVVVEGLFVVVQGGARRVLGHVADGNDIVACEAANLWPSAGLPNFAVERRQDVVVESGVGVVARAAESTGGGRSTFGFGEFDPHTQLAQA